MRYIINIIRILFLVLFLYLIMNGKMMIWLGIFAISLIAALFFGRVYCGYACPMNTLMIPTEWLSKKLKIQTDYTPDWLRSGKFAWVALVVSIAAVMIIQRVFHRNIPILPIWIATSVIITLKYRPAVFHNHICPFGALLKVFGRFGRLSKKVINQTCIGCELCEKVCPSNAITVSSDNKKAAINTAKCLQCSSCQQVCPKNAIHYAK